MPEVKKPLFYKQYTALLESFWSKRQLVILISNVLASFGCAVCISQQGPFFPAECELKNVRASIYGFVFGVYALTVFIMAPLFGKYIAQIGPRFMLNAGIFVTSVCCILFGLLDKVKSGSSFITLAFLIRIVEASGEASFTTACYSIMAEIFPDHIGTTFAFLRAAFGIGLTVGPTVGGSLYQIGGFGLPFFTMGTFLLITTLVLIVIFWKTEEFTPIKSSESVLKALQIPDVFLSMTSASTAALSIGFLYATTEPHLQHFQGTITTTSLAFFTTAGSQAISYIFWAWICNGKLPLKPIIASGHLLLCVTYVLVGPAPFVFSDGKLWWCFIGMSFHGFGVGALLLASHIEALKSAKSNGYSDTLQTLGLITGLWTAFFQMGNFIGPSVGGILFEYFGFRFASLFPLTMHILMMMVHSIRHLLLNKFVIK